MYDRKLRKVWFKTIIREGKELQNVSGIGYFHQWGIKMVEFETGPGQYTVGIIETAKGQVMEIEPEGIQFLHIENPEYVKL